MSRGLPLPPNYSIRPARDLIDRWAVYRLLILEREREPNQSELARVILHPYTLLLPALLSLMLIVSGFFVRLSNESYSLLFLVLFFLGFVGVFQVSFLYQLFVRYRRRLIVAFDRSQIVGSALMALRENYSVLLAMYVAPGHRNRGVGSQLIQSLLSREALPIYLYAIPELRSFYTRFGFVTTNRMSGYNMVLQRLN